MYDYNLPLNSMIWVVTEVVTGIVQIQDCPVRSRWGGGGGGATQLGKKPINLKRITNKKKLKKLANKKKKKLL